MGSDLRAQAEQLSCGHDWMVDAIESALRGVRDAERERLKGAILSRRDLSEGAAKKYAQEGNQSLVDYHAGCMGVCFCLLEDLREAIEEGADHAD